MKTFFLVVTALIINTALPCTIFSIYPDNQHWIGRTFDWDYGHGLLFTNKKDITKQGLKLLSTDVPATWTSKYGSVTFNQFGREFPNGGMNEAGLMIEALELKTAKFQKADARPSFNELQFIQYILDRFATIEEIKTALKDVRLSPVGSKLHYFACDIKHCMTIEYIDGELVIYMDKDLEVSSLANNAYNEHLEYTRNFVTFGGKKLIDLSSNKSLDRFLIASYEAKLISEQKDPVEYIFGILDEVGTRHNRWQIIYNQDEKTITFRTKAKLDLQRKIDLKHFDFTCSVPVQYFDLENNESGLINDRFLNFNPTTNRSLIQKSVKQQRQPPKLVDILAHYSERTLCP